jgi:hypothetical protein
MTPHGSPALEEAPPPSDLPGTGGDGCSLEPPRSGSPCPGCGKGRLDYNGLLDLECPSCGYTLSGGAGCT